MCVCAYVCVCVRACVCPQENVSLADILSLRDTCLTEQEVWAVCVECVLALQSIAPSTLFHTLCITPDTLAFNAHGNVCFMEQLSDDPEGSFIPPEFDKTGSTFEGHMYSLGSTLSSALDFVIEPELEAELGEEIQRVLEQMQEKGPGDRPHPQDILSLAEEKLEHTSSKVLCRKLSSIGRRVLSIESVATYQGLPLGMRYLCAFLFKHPFLLVWVGIYPPAVAAQVRDADPAPPLAHPTLVAPLVREASSPTPDWGPSEWISLRDLLTRSGQRWSVNELWALCHTCLSTLQTYIDYPAYLCLDTVYVGCEGEVLFLKPKNTGSCDAFYLAPEFQEHGIVTEKACVYGVAAILWATAKFNLSANQKLAMPRKLKRLLLEMAKKTPFERPSIVIAKKVLIQEAPVTRSLKKWPDEADAKLQDCFASIDMEYVLGFLRCRLAPVPGPVPHSYPISGAPQLPEAFTSPATHFTPIVLTREGDTEEETPLGSEIQPVQEAKHPETPLHLEDLPLPQSDRDLQDSGQDSPVNQKNVVTRHSSSTASSSRTLVNSPPPASPKLTTQLSFSSSCQLSSCSHLTGGGVFNNFLLRHDPLTGDLTLVPVQITVAESLHGLESTCSKPLDSLVSMSQPHNGEEGPRTGEREDEALSESHGPPQGDSHLMHPSLQEVIGLLRAEFAIDGYLENGLEDLAMGEYILSLKDLQYQTFCNVVKEKFCDLSWDEDLLGVLHCVVNYHQFSLAAECLGKGAMESAEHPVGVSDESPPEADSLCGMDEPLRVGHLGRMSCSKDMEDQESLVFERLLSPCSRAEESSHRLSPAWGLAFYGEDCFSHDVMEYAITLGQHSESPCLELKTQELQQQHMIEMKNLKKTRNFYQKLLHQERKNKGSEARLMLSKLKIQFEELRSKVEFLDCVKKYLEVLSVDQWGMDMSLLPSLAASGPGSPLDLQPSEEPAMLGLVSLSGAERGKSSLQAATPLGLMTYLYARNALLEGYIQQFLYTYRYFCTPQELLQFLMEKFNSAVAAGGGPNVSGDRAKVYHRSLDVLQTWLTDCRLVDFSPKSILLITLENFLTNDVSPVDSRGERLLTTLQSSPRRRWSQSCGSPISMHEEDDALSSHTICRKSHSFQWKISRVVEPQATQTKDQAYSLAAALPRPCYTSLMDDISSACLRSEERHPFSQSEHSAQHTAQQLTLLQQEMFQGCHPNNFLNSRAQGVGDKAFSVTKISPLLFLLQIQAALLTKFLLIAKHCYEFRDFATAMQVLGGLENVFVRQLPAWKHLSTKVCEVLEELRAVQVFLKSDNLCLMGGDHVRRRPTLPAAHILAMHIQQLEIGAFTLTSGAYKWPKLRTIAKVVSQVHAFQETVYSFTPDLELQAYLRLRIAHLSGCDIPLLAADNEANFHHTPTERHTRRIQDTLKRVKATFQ
uniref:Kinase non-catalytic C-lobe domain containing 1 n=1 Tax=Oncorhynchus kisutch TaxID=8019 RepID=A0A8C7D3R7_ONCKI